MSRETCARLMLGYALVEIPPLLFASLLRSAILSGNRGEKPIFHKVVSSAAAGP